jgi:hypothetical protein
MKKLVKLSTSISLYKNASAAKLTGKETQTVSFSEVRKGVGRSQIFRCREHQKSRRKDVKVSVRQTVASDAGTGPARKMGPVVGANPMYSVMNHKTTQRRR